MNILQLSGCLDRLTPHVRLNGVAITGGVGMQSGLAGQALQGFRDHAADLDLVATSIDAIASGIVQQFLVSHYHAVRPGVPKFMIQLVDPVSRIRVYVFPDLASSLGDARTIAIGRHSIQVLPLERIFEHKVQTLSRASPSARRPWRCRRWGKRRRSPPRSWIPTVTSCRGPRCRGRCWATAR